MPAVLPTGDLASFGFVSKAADVGETGRDGCGGGGGRPRRIEGKNCEKRAGDTPWEQDEGTSTHFLSPGDQSLVGFGDSDWIGWGWSCTGGECISGFQGGCAGTGGAGLVDLNNLPPGSSW